MLDVADLVTAYGKIEALKGVSLHVESGRITCLLGPNGAGKTTLMMSIAAILKPRRGSIRLDGDELVGLTPAKIVAKGVALVPENRLVFPQMSVLENLYAGAYQRKDNADVEVDIERMYKRFPRLKVVMIEGGFAWLPALAWRLDKLAERMRSEVPHLKKKPSEYIRQHIWVTTQPMEEPENRQHLFDTMEWIGWDRLLFASDYPHWDFDDPFRAFPAGLPQERYKQILTGNGRAVYRLG